ncbi:EamA family transporter [Aeromicrobium sp. A1-2]|uniref:DMT family transporter n=1 Tax=Aeromicrobium sp. A1-2 TaxID=2107713 RepID=UPI000E50EC00|nr:DMT family transporter [Aeromicrobium sp. A1-2]AXT84719.1 EamA family transporter [Aeromicrobium sp. A1-2]
MRTRLAAAALLAVTAVWGSTFFLIKDLLDRIPATDFLAVRFAIAFAAMFLLAPQAISRLSPEVRRRSAYAGGIYGVAQILQTVGLGHTDASVSGFITGLYVVATPVLASLAFRQRVSRTVWIAVGLSTVGLAILSLRGFSVGFGESITFVCAILYAVHIIVLSRWSTAADAYAMATIQMGVIAALCLVAAAPGGVTIPHRSDDWIAVVYMALAAGALAMVLQTWAQSQLDAARSALLMTMEPVFAATFAITLGTEGVSWRLLLGGSFVLTAMVLAETSGRSETPVQIPLD